MIEQTLLLRRVPSATGPFSLCTVRVTTMQANRIKNGFGGSRTKGGKPPRALQRLSGRRPQARRRPEPTMMAQPRSIGGSMVSPNMMTPRPTPNSSRV